MGWSANWAAFQALGLMEKACLKSTGEQNLWTTENGEQYFWEASNVEYPDGHISGEIYKLRKEDQYCKRVGSFYINPNGTFRRIPGSLRKLVDQIPRELTISWA